MYADDFFWTGIIVFAFLIIAGLFVWAGVADENHNDRMKQEYSQCQKDGKEWVLTKDNGSLDGICVTQR